ncbi:Protein of unknown function [Tenacibaculum sp. MAR_2009_124]|uniref:DUF2490 domain-containing protein n=1 Tax=Tenacibaculum sp. MAR_2009_124 TaxID=1250059 RepID=UPI0008974EB0|nr:DUF2490 domain-containing protein [Tenacibaculum sp. MAR_2009_124]SEB75268.1 Protein of unknown function [Tenacibaculum sp. MAR_2009_124]
MVKKVIFLIFVCTSLNIFSQKNPEKSLGVWYMYGGSFQLSENWTIKSLAHFRMFDITNDLQQYLYRVGANYKINKTFSVTGGYAYLNTDTTFDLDGGNADEHRLYEDFNIKHKISKLGLNHRFRLEHRFFEKDTQHWIRYQLGLSYPITKTLSAFVFDEVFFNFQGETYAQNWIGGGITYKASNNIKLKVGYMNISDKNIGLDRVQLGVIFNTKLHK